MSELSTESQSTEQNAGVIAGGNSAVESQKSASVNSDETTDESETSENDSLDNDSQGSESKQGKNGFDKRIKKLGRQRSEAQAEAHRAKLDAEYWKAKALEGKSTYKETETKQVAKSDADSKPDPNNFDTNAEYIDALTDWKLDQKEKKVLEAKAQENAKSEFSKKQQSHQSRVDAYKKANPSYVDDLTNFLEEHGDDNGEYYFSPTFTELIVDSEHGTAVLHKLALDKSELDRINSLPPLAAAREFGKYEARIAKESKSENEETETKTTSKAPAPISPVGSKTAGMIAKSSSEPNISYAEYERRRRAEMKAKRK